MNRIGKVTAFGLLLAGCYEGVPPGNTGSGDTGTSSAAVTDSADEGPTGGTAPTTGDSAGTDNPGTSAGETESDSDDLPPPPSDNVIDVAMWPLIVAEGANPLPPASRRELCRRMALDLWGMVPTPGEFSSLCQGEEPEAMARAMMDDARFVERESRLWIRLIGTDAPDIFSIHLPDADPIYERLATGEITYDQFAGELLAHPVLAISRPIAEGDDPTFTINQAFRIFLGRPAQGTEKAAFENLMRVWHRGFESRPGPGGSYKYPAYLQPDECVDPVYGNALCSSDLFGVEMSIDLADVFFPLGPPEQYENQRDGVYYFEMAHGGNVPPEYQAELIKPGLLLATQQEFWDESGERALTRILGWWRSTLNEPESTVPSVRTALGAWWRDHDTHDIRDLYAEILTSLLYTTAAQVGDEVDSRSVWAVGPTRLMDGEQYLDSLEAAFERELGFCDSHTADAIGSGDYDDILRDPQPPDFYGFGYDAYYDWGQKLGGCVGGAAVPRQPGLRAVFAHTEIATTLCTAPSAVTSAGFDVYDTSEANQHAAIEHLYERLLTRLPDDEEWQVLDEAAQNCLADGTCGADGLNGLIGEVCGAILRSGEFAFY